MSGAADKGSWNEGTLHTFSLRWTQVTGRGIEHGRVDAAKDTPIPQERPVAVLRFSRVNGLRMSAIRLWSGPGLLSCVVVPVLAC